VEIDPTDALRGQFDEQDTADNRSCDAENDVGDDTPSLFVRHPAGDKANDDPQNNPSNNGH
jgi:hypothetical protein